MAKNATGTHKDLADKLVALRRGALAFAAFFAGLDPAGVPLFVFCVGGAEPALAVFAEDGGGLVAGFV
jgi:hypothetical protein